MLLNTDILRVVIHIGTLLRFLKINSNTEVEINVGPSTTPSNFVGGGTIQGAIPHLEYKTILQVGEMLLQMVHLLRR